MNRKTDNRCNKSSCSGPFLWVAQRMLASTFVLSCALYPAWSWAVSWTNINGGIYSNPLNWSTSSPPTSSQDAVFNLGASTAYTVNLTASTTANRLVVYTDTVDFGLGGFIYNTVNAVSIGQSAGNAGILDVANGTFNVGGQLIVGEFGTGTLVLDNNITVNSGDGNVGFVGGSNGTVVLSGSGSSWNNSGTLYSGWAGTGNINVSNGADLTSASSQIGKGANGNGTITIDGIGSTWNNSGSVYIGGSTTAAGGTGVLDVQNGGAVDVGGTVRLWSGGTLNLDGGSLTTGSFDNSALGTFNFTDGTLTVDGGTYDDGNTTLTVNSTGAGDNPTLVLNNGAQADYSASGNTLVGDDGRGTLNINSGSLLTNSIGAVGVTSSGNGTVTVSGTGSTWANNNYLAVGIWGTGILNINNGGLVSNTYGYLGDNVGGNGTVTVSGTGSTWANSESLWMGKADTATGSLNINSGGTVSNTDGRIGFITGSAGAAVVDGAGSAWDNSAGLYVGDSGAGSLSISSGAEVSDTAGYIGYSAGGSGSAVVDGAGSTWDNSSDLRVGGAGVGDLTISNNATVNSLYSYVGAEAGSTGTVLVESGGSWNSNSWHIVGWSGAGDLVIQNGGLLATGTNAHIGSLAGSLGAVLVDGAASNWSVNSGMYLGGSASTNGGTGTLTVQNSGNVNVTGLLKLWDAGTLNLAGGSINAGSFDATAALAAFNFTDGTFTVDGGTYDDGNNHPTIDSTGAGDNPTLVLSNGASADYSSKGNVTIGFDGTGTLNIDSGSSFANRFGQVGWSTGSNGTVTVSGTDATTGTASTWASSNDLSIGHWGTGTLNIDGGGLVTAPSSYLGHRNGSNGTATVSGIDLATGLASTWANSDSLYVGGSSIAGGTGLLTVGTGGVVNVTNLLKIWGLGTVNLNGGTINTGMLDPLDGTFNYTAGALNLTNSDLLVDAGGILGGAINLSVFKSLGVSGSTTLNGVSTLTLDGGTFSTGSLVDNGGFTFNKGTFNLTGDNLTIGAGGLFGSIVQFGINQAVNVTNATTVDNGSVLSLANGTFTSGTTINNGTVDLDGPVSTLGGGAVTNNSLITGDGRITASLTNTASSEIRVLTGDMLSFTAAGNTNQGAINLLGGAITFDQDLTNDTGGNIVGSGSLAVSGGLANQGTLALSGGTTSMLGDVNNTTGGTIIISGNSTATFFDDVIHNGTEIRVSSGSSAVFFGAISGSGAYTGTGSLFFEGDLNPGNSPGLVSIEGDMGLGLSSHTIMEIAGLGRGTEYDAFDIGGDLWLGGMLEVSLYDLGGDLFTPQLGDSFDLFMADTITGGFDLLTLAALGGGLGLQVDILADAIGLTDVVRLSVVTSAVPVPPAVWLFVSGLLGLVVTARRRHAA